MKLRSIILVGAVILGGLTAVSFTMMPASSPKTSQTAAKSELDLDFTLVNSTGYDIEHVYIAPNKSTEWGDDVLEGGVLKKGASVKIVFHPKATAKLWDISVGWVGYDPSEDVVWSKFDLTTIDKVTLKYDEKTNVTTAVTE